MRVRRGRWGGRQEGLIKLLDKKGEETLIKVFGYRISMGKQCIREKGMKKNGK